MCRGIAITSLIYKCHVRMSSPQMRAFLLFSLRAYLHLKFAGVRGIDNGGVL
jgi:hypothetical protein